MSNAPISIQGYGLNQPLNALASRPIIGKRAPLTTDRAQIGQIWVYPATNSAWVLTSVVANVSTWSDISGGVGQFTSLVVTPGPINLTGAFTLTAGTNAVHFADDAADHAITIGSGTGSSALTLNSGSGGIGLTPATNANINLNTDGTGTTTLGKTTTTGAIFIGISTSGQAISIGGAINTGAQSISLGSGAGATAASTVNILTGASGASGTQTLNILTGASVATQAANIFTSTKGGTIAIANGATAGNINTVTLGGTNGASATTINSGTAALNLTMAAPAAGAGGILVTQGAVPFRILCGAGAPNNNLAIEAGDLYINSTGNSSSTRMYIATGAGAWTNVTTAA